MNSGERRREALPMGLLVFFHPPRHPLLSRHTTAEPTPAMMECLYQIDIESRAAAPKNRGFHRPLCLMTWQGRAAYAAYSSNSASRSAPALINADCRRKRKRI